MLNSASHPAITEIRDQHLLAAANSRTWPLNRLPFGTERTPQPSNLTRPVMSVLTPKAKVAWYPA